MVLPAPLPLILFIAVCEDRDLLPRDTIHEAYDIKGFSAAKNPRWESFKALFSHINAGFQNPRQPERSIPADNGGLFAPPSPRYSGQRQLNLWLTSPRYSGERGWG